MVNAIAPALALIQSSPDIALVFSDVVLLGGETGFQLADQLRQTHPHLPILFCSGYAEGALEQHFAEGERPPVLAKPYAREDLGSAVREMIDGVSGKR
jgi:CheY-like chemotaxis protein